jgi:hypothetical protein
VKIEMEIWWKNECQKMKSQVLRDYQDTDPLRVMTLAEAASGTGLKRFFMEQINSFAHPESGQDNSVSPMPLLILKDMAKKMGIKEADVFAEIARRKPYFNNLKG